MWWQNLVITSLTAFASPSSPWAPAEWRLQLDVGREEGTWMPETWATSGARLLFSVDVSIEAEGAEQRDAELKFMGPNANRVVVLEDATFVNQNGEQIIRIAEEGGWKVHFSRGSADGAASTCRLWIDLEANPDLPGGQIAAIRNDVSLSAERLYFMAQCWRETDFQKGKQRIKPLEQAAREAQERLERQLNHESGDRRLDGKDIVDTLAGSFSMAQLVMDRDNKLRDLREAERTLPGKLVSLPGHWPGTTEPFVLARGTLAVKRKKLLREEFHIVGKWRAAPLTNSVISNKFEEKIGKI